MAFATVACGGRICCWGAFALHFYMAFATVACGGRI